MTLYETDFDRKREERLMKIMQEHTGLDFVKAPDLSVIDALAYSDGEFKCFFEFKCRSVASFTYPSFMIEMNKVIAANNLAQATKKKAWLCVEWTNQIGVIDFASDIEVGVSKRRDRDIPAQLMAYYPIAGFKVMDLYST